MAGNDKSDPGYKEARARQNQAVQKCRQNQKKKTEETQKRVDELKQVN